MTRGLQDQPQFARLLAGLLRQADGGRGPPLRVRVAVRPAGVEVDVVAADADPAVATRPLTVTLATTTAGRAARRRRPSRSRPATGTSCCRA